MEKRSDELETIFLIIELLEKENAKRLGEPQNDVSPGVLDKVQAERASKKDTEHSDTEKMAKGLRSLKQVVKRRRLVCTVAPQVRPVADDSLASGDQRTTDNNPATTEPTNHDVITADDADNSDAISTGTYVISSPRVTHMRTRAYSVEDGDGGSVWELCSVSSTDTVDEVSSTVYEGSVKDLRADFGEFEGFPEPLFEVLVDRSDERFWFGPNAPICSKAVIENDLVIEDISDDE